MERFLEYVKKNLGYSDYEIALLKYFFTAVFYDVSKFILLGIAFGFAGYFVEYLLASVVLVFFRISSGGLHFKTYWSCFLFSLVFFTLCIVILPEFSPSKTIQMIILLICLAIVNRIGPITSKYRKKPDVILIQKSKKDCSIIIFSYCILTFVIPLNHYINTGFWVIILQTLQLVIAKIFKRRCSHEN